MANEQLPDFDQRRLAELRPESEVNKCADDLFVFTEPGLFFKEPAATWNVMAHGARLLRHLLGERKMLVRMLEEKEKPS